MHAVSDNAVSIVDVAKVDAAIVIGCDNGMNSVIAQPDMGSVADLRGKAVAVDAPNTAFAFQLYEFLRQKGMNKEDYAVKSVGATGPRFEAMQQDKTLAATMLYPPFSISAAKAGFKDFGEATKSYRPLSGLFRHCPSGMGQRQRRHARALPRRLYRRSALRPRPAQHGRNR